MFLSSKAVDICHPQISINQISGSVSIMNFMFALLVSGSKTGEYSANNLMS